MKIRKFNGFDEHGYLPYGMYNMSVYEFEDIFCTFSKKREEIRFEHKKHLKEIQNTGYFIDHWIGGSYISDKKYPHDIDTLSEFDGIEVNKNRDNEIIDELINNSKLHTNGLCHSLKVYRYPPSDEIKYDYYLKSKIRILTTLFDTDKNGIAKGVIHLIGVKQ